MKIHANLSRARKAKNDEFYTQMKDIENELQHYENHFKAQVVYCNCDNPDTSNFPKYFRENYDKLKLKGLLISHFNHETGEEDFRSERSISLLKQADIIVTNPPFSLFREYFAQLIEHKKKFLIIGNINAAAWDDVAPLIKSNKVWVGVNYNKSLDFMLPGDYEKYAYTDDCGNNYGKVPGICWYTNLSHSQQGKKLELKAIYAPEKYPKYDNFDAIEVDRVKKIPADYNGVMGVPITFLGKYNPEQFEIVKFRRGDDGKFLRINGEVVYARILIRKKNGHLISHQP